jgi:thiamine-monophosphate kinase
MVGDRFNDETLADMGEFRILRDIVHPVLKDVSIPQGLGDDCGCSAIGDTGFDLVVTTDATPRPLLSCLGHNAYHTWGWYSVVINLSDLAAAGASPTLFVSCIDAPGSMLSREFEDFFRGVAGACKAYGVANAGGNIRSAPCFSASGTAIGIVRSGRQIRRVGCEPEDVLVCIGTCGMFSSTYLKAKSLGMAHLSENELACLSRPIARTREMSILSDRQLITAASDNSDGVLGALWNIAEASQCAIRLGMSDEHLPAIVCASAKEYGYDPWNLMFCWGDWQVVAAVRAGALTEFYETARREGIAYFPLGVAARGEPGVFAAGNGSQRKLVILRNESFSPSSFSNDAEGQFRRMLTTPVFDERSI